MRESSSALLLSIEHPRYRKELRLFVGQKIRFGRSQKADVIIDLPGLDEFVAAVSTPNGKSLVIESLRPRGGLYDGSGQERERIFLNKPDGSEAIFFGQEKFYLSWHQESVLVEATELLSEQKELERTELLDESEPLKRKAEASERPSRRDFDQGFGELETQAGIDPQGATLLDSSTNIESGQAEELFSSRSVWRSLLVYFDRFRIYIAALTLMLPLFYFFYFWSETLFPFQGSEKGAVADYLFSYIYWTKNHLLELFLRFNLSFLLMGLLIFTLVKKLSLRLSFLTLHLLFHALAILSPLMVVWTHGFKKPEFSSARQFYLATKLQDRGDEKVKLLKAHSRIFKGSSYVYLQFFNNRRNRLKNECEGNFDESSWARRKFCLVLMAAIASESYNDAKPDYLRNESQMLNHLLALDGITRVLRVEGPRSESLQFFVKTLENTDQSDEKALLLKILSGEGGAVESQDQLFSQLNQMRREIDKKLLASIEEKNKKFFIPFSIPDPLELGI